MITGRHVGPRPSMCKERVEARGLPRVPSVSLQRLHHSALAFHFSEILSEINEEEWVDFRHEPDNPQGQTCRKLIQKKDHHKIEWKVCTKHLCGTGVAHACGRLQPYRVCLDHAKSCKIGIVVNCSIFCFFGKYYPTMR